MPVMNHYTNDELLMLADDYLNSWDSMNPTALGKPPLYRLVNDLAEALRAALAARPQPDAGPWPKFCPWCMAEFNADGTVTAPEAVAGSATPTEEDT